MRIYTDPVQAIRETERDLWEMGIDVHPQTMQDKDVGQDDDYKTKELQAYGFQLSGVEATETVIQRMAQYLYGIDTPEFHNVYSYILAEFRDRTENVQRNPGNAYKLRQGIWDEFLHNGKFAYTYSERIAPQLEKIITELTLRPDTRQGIINIHTNICPLDAVPEGDVVIPSADWHNMGGSGRIPCSMYYQIICRKDRVDFIYTMRSCDFLTHFTVDIVLALMMQDYVATRLGLDHGTFTYFTGSLHAYQKDMKARGIF